MNHTKDNCFGIKNLVDARGEGEHFHLDSDSMHPWTAKTAKEYKAIEKRINKIGTKNKAFHVYAWYDVSGFDYWVRRQCEPNYIQISVVLKKKTLNEKDIVVLKLALKDAESDAECIEYDCESEVYELYQPRQGAANE